MHQYNEFLVHPCIPMFPYYHGNFILAQLLNLTTQLNAPTRTCGGIIKSFRLTHDFINKVKPLSGSLGLLLLGGGGFDHCSTTTRRSEIKLSKSGLEFCTIKCRKLLQIRIKLIFNVYNYWL